MTDIGAALDRLTALATQRATADPETSYTAKLLSAGVPRIAKKLGEEAVETVIAAVEGDRDAVKTESADLLYHLCVLWAACGVSPQDVANELKQREGVSGIEEKAGREGK